MWASTMRKQPLIVRFQIAHITHLLEPTLPNGHTHLSTVCVRTHDGQEFTDRSFVEKVGFRPNYSPDQIIESPPFMISVACKPKPTAYENRVGMTIWLEEEEYEFEYDLIFSMELSASHFTTATFYISEPSPALHAMATRFGADNIIRSGETRFIGLPGIVRPPLLDSLNIASPESKKRRVNDDCFDLLALPNELIAQIFSYLPIEDRFRARVNKKLDEIELKAKYFVRELNIREVPVNHPHALSNCFDGQEIKFFEEKSYSADCVKRIARNASVGSLILSLTGLYTFHRNVYIMITELNIMRLELHFDNEETAEAVMNDSYFLHFAKTCELLELNPCPKITPKALFEVYTKMLEESISLHTIQFGSYTYKSLLTSFFKLAGINYIYNRFYASPGIEIYGNESDDNDYETVHIFKRRVQISIYDKPPFDNNEEFFMHFTLHKTNEALEEAKNECGRIV